MPTTNRVTAVLSDQVVKAKVLTGSGIIRPYSPADAVPAGEDASRTGASARPVASRRSPYVLPTPSASSTSWAS